MATITPRAWRAALLFSFLTCFALAEQAAAAAQANLVRGYLAVAVGRSNKAEASGGIYAREYPAQDIYLPDVSVWIEDPQNNLKSDAVKTDLSGRFTLLAPKKSSYRLCWKSDLIGGDCLSGTFKAGAEPLFLSTLLVRVPPRQGFMASFGKVRFADDSAPRTLEPLANVNAYARVVALDKNNNRIAETPVNNFGYYLLPYLPKNDPVTIVARIEKTETPQLILPENYQKHSRLVRSHLTLNNTPPRLDAIVPIDGSGKRVQLGALGATVELKVQTRDRDGDPVKLSWLAHPGSGTLSATSGDTVKWTLPAQAGRFAVVAIASDGKGGYARQTVRLEAGTPGVPFAGTVAGTDGALLGNADVEINGQHFNTDAQGRLLARVPSAERYVFNIRKPSYGFYSRIYDRGIAGVRWTLIKASVAKFNPGSPIVFQDKRSRRSCPGLDTARVNWKANPAATQVWWQDGQGNNVPPPLAKMRRDTPRLVNARERHEQRPRDDIKQASAILPWKQRPLPPCGPGAKVKIPANGLQTAGGGAPNGQVEVSLSTVDLASAEQMPGDATVDLGGGATGWMQSYGAVNVALRDASGAPLNLKPGTTAQIAIPVDRMQLAAGGPLPASAPLLYYDEVKGTWREEGALTLDATKKFYVATVKHFSTINTDLVKTNPSCVRVQSSITPPYDLEVTIPMPNGAAPVVKKVTITDAPPHVIYNLPNNTNITLVALAPGSATVPPRVLGVFVVNSGGPHATGFGTPPPASACASEASLSTQSFPTQPVSGEFLHGLFAFSATNINELAPADAAALDAATSNYYAQIDPASERTTLTGFLNKNGFTKPPGFQLCGAVPCDNPDTEVNVAFGNSGDLGFGRDMHCRRSATASGFDYACYVTNYGDITTDDSLDAESARTNTAPIATVAMEFSRLAASDPVTDRHVKFYVYNGAGTRINAADLDGKGARPVPQLCMVCHGGAYPAGGTTGVPNFTTPASVKLGSRFLPFDLRFYTFPASVPKAAQQAAFKRLNQDIVRNAPLLPAPNPIGEVIDGMYAGGVANQKEEFVTAGWLSSTLPNTAAQEQFYKRTLGNACRTCHIAQPFQNVSNERAGVDLTFRTARDFLRSQAITGGGSFSPFSSAETRVCVDHVMPHALRTHDIFWGQYWQNAFGAISPTLVAQFQAFGDTIKALPRPAGWPAAETWPPAWNGQLCGQFFAAGSAPPSYYSSMVHILWSRNLGTRNCITCHSSDLGGNATDTRNALLSGFFGGGSPEVVVNNANGSRVVKRLRGTETPRMPQGCPSSANRCLTETGSYNVATDTNPADASQEIDRIVHWINNGAAP